MYDILSRKWTKIKHKHAIFQSSEISARASENPWRNVQKFCVQKYLVRNPWLLMYYPHINELVARFIPGTKAIRCLISFCESLYLSPFSLIGNLSCLFYNEDARNSLIHHKGHTVYKFVSLESRGNSLKENLCLSCKQLLSQSIPKADIKKILWKILQHLPNKNNLSCPTLPVSFTVHITIIRWQNCLHNCKETYLFSSFWILWQSGPIVCPFQGLSTILMLSTPCMKTLYRQTVLSDSLIRCDN